MKLFVFAFFFILSFTLRAQFKALSSYSDTTFEYTFGGSGVDLFRSIAVTSDTCIVAIGSTSSCNLPNSELFFIKTDSSAYKTIWAKALGIGNGIGAAGHI